MKCVECGKEVDEKAKFCKYCGRPLEKLSNEKRCAICGALVGPDEKFCTECGAPIEIDLKTQDASEENKNVETEGKYKGHFEKGVFLIAMLIFGCTLYFSIMKEKEKEAINNLDEAVVENDVGSNSELEQITEVPLDQQPPEETGVPQKDTSEKEEALTEEAKVFEPGTRTAEETAPVEEEIPENDIPDTTRETLETVYSFMISEDYEGLYQWMLSNYMTSGLPYDIAGFEENYYQEGGVLTTIESGYGMYVGGYSVTVGEFTNGVLNGTGVRVSGPVPHRPHVRIVKGTWIEGNEMGYFEVTNRHGYVDDYDITYAGNVINGLWDGEVRMSWTQLSTGISDSAIINASYGDFPVLRQEGEKYIYAEGSTTGVYWWVDNENSLRHRSITD